MESGSIEAEREELIGKIKRESRLPQYLITAILTGAVQRTDRLSGRRNNATGEKQKKRKKNDEHQRGNKTNEIKREIKRERERERESE